MAFILALESLHTFYPLSIRLVSPALLDFQSQYRSHLEGPAPRYQVGERNVICADPSRSSSPRSYWCCPVLVAPSANCPALAALAYWSGGLVSTWNFCF